MAHQVPRMDETESAAWLALVSILELLPASLDAQLQRDSEITHFEFMVLSLLRFAPDRTMRMKELAGQTNSTLPRLSHVASRLEQRGIVERSPCASDKRATNVTLTDLGRRVVIRATPGHLEHVRRMVLDQLDGDDVDDLARIARKIGRNLDPGDRLMGTLRRSGG